MTLFKSKRRRQAERAVARAYDLRDGVAERVAKKRQTLRDSSDHAIRTVKSDARSLKKRAGEDAQAARRASLKSARFVKSKASTAAHVAEVKAARVSSNIAEMVRENPAASIGGALAIAIAIGAGTTYWMRDPD